MKQLTVLAAAILMIALFFVFHRVRYEHKIVQLRESIQSGDVAAVSQLITRSPELIEVDMNQDRREKLTPLSLASGLGREVVCSALLSAGANVNAQDKFGLTPLHKAISIADTNIIFNLLQHGADASIRNAQGETPLDFVRERIPSENLRADILTAINETTNRSVKK